MGRSPGFGRPGGLSTDSQAILSGSRPSRAVDRLLHPFPFSVVSMVNVNPSARTEQCLCDGQRGVPRHSGDLCRRPDEVPRFGDTCGQPYLRSGMMNDDITDLRMRSPRLPAQRASWFESLMRPAPMPQPQPVSECEPIAAVMQGRASIGSPSARGKRPLPPHACLGDEWSVSAPRLGHCHSWYPFSPSNGAFPLILRERRARTRFDLIRILAQ
jgi:hypothetical protein